MTASIKAVQRIADQAARLVNGIANLANLDYSRLAPVAAGALAIAGGVALIAGGVMIGGSCLAVTEGAGAVHCIIIGGQVSTFGLGAVYVGVGVIKR